MANSPRQFKDPTGYPVVFDPMSSGRIINFGQTGFPVTFVFFRLPRQAIFKSVVARNMGIFLTSKDVYGSNVVQTAKGEQRTIELYATNTDITDVDFKLKIPRFSGQPLWMAAGSVGEIRQPQYSKNISHVFSMTPSVSNFLPYTFEAVDYYPVATLYLEFHPMLENYSTSWTDLELPIMLDTEVLVAPAGAYGVLDVMATVVVKWYLNEARTVPSIVSPYNIPDTAFGMRFHLSQTGMLLNKIQTNTTGSCIVQSVYPTSVATLLGYGTIDLQYWGGGERSTDIFFGHVQNVVISDTGLLIQDGDVVAAYVLEHPLTDLDTSSSSCSTTTVNMSTSSITNPPSSSSHSSSSLSSSISSASSITSISSMSTSSISSNSSSTQIMTSSSSSSSTSSSSIIESHSSNSSSSTHVRTSSSSLIENIVLHYPFDTEADEQNFYTVYDASDMGNDAKLGQISYGLGPPTWGTTYGTGGTGGYKFTADTNNSDYMYSRTINGLSSPRGSVVLHVKISPSPPPIEGGRINYIANSPSIPFCISNGHVLAKTEFYMKIDMTDGQSRLYVGLMVGGVTKWEAASSVSSLSVDRWTQIAVVQNGVQPAIYINGVEDTSTFTVSVDKKLWLSALSSAVSPSNMAVVGAAPRYYTPYMALGFSGFVDELKIWDVALAPGDILANYQITLVSSSSSSSSNSSESTT